MPTLTGSVTKKIIKSAQESSVEELRGEVKRRTGVEIVPQQSHVGESQSNGRVERANRDAQQQTRVMRSQLEGRYGRQIVAKNKKAA